MVRLRARARVRARARAKARATARARGTSLSSVRSLFCSSASVVADFSASSCSSVCVSSSETPGCGRVASEGMARRPAPKGLKVLG